MFGKNGFTSIVIRRFFMKNFKEVVHIEKQRTT